MFYDLSWIEQQNFIKKRIIYFQKFLDIQFLNVPYESLFLNETLFN